MSIIWCNILSRIIDSYLKIPLKYLYIIHLTNPCYSIESFTTVLICEYISFLWFLNNNISFTGFKLTSFPFLQDSELNKIAAFFNAFTFFLTCAALAQPSWFRIKGLHCTQSLSLTQFFTFDDDDDDDDQIIIQNKELDPLSRSDFIGTI